MGGAFSFWKFQMLKKSDDLLLSDADSAAGRLQRAALELLREHERAGDIPTNGRFLFYELEQRGVIPKKYDGKARTPLQDVSVATMRLRESGLVPWSWIADESRSLQRWRFAPDVRQYLIDTIEHVRVDLWEGEEPPLIVCESRATAGVLNDLAYEYLVPITATGGQCGGFLVTDVVPLLGGSRRVLYIGDYENRGPADQIEANTRRYIERHTGRVFAPDEWTKIALTEQQVKASKRLQGLEITKLDRRNKPAKSYRAIECEALGQGVLVRLIRRHLDRLLPQPIAPMREREDHERMQMLAALQRIKGSSLYYRSDW
jgi:hypothetical protein